MCQRSFDLYSRKAQPNAGLIGEMAGTTPLARGEMTRSLGAAWGKQGQNDRPDNEELVGYF